MLALHMPAISAIYEPYLDVATSDLQYRSLAVAQLLRRAAIHLHKQPELQPPHTHWLTLEHRTSRTWTAGLAPSSTTLIWAPVVSCKPRITEPPVPMIAPTCSLATGNTSVPAVAGTCQDSRCPQRPADS